MPSPTGSPGDLSRRLFDREPALDASDPGSVHSVCEQFYGDLTRWTGAAGCDVLFRRACSITQRTHPALEGICIDADRSPHIVGVGDVVGKLGPEATAAALRALLISVLELLGRLIGAELVAAIVDWSIATHRKWGASTPGETM